MANTRKVSEPKTNRHTKVSAAPNKTGEDRTFEVEVTTFYNSGIVTGVQKGQ